jgi:hypothetical protein
LLLSYHRFTTPATPQSSDPATPPSERFVVGPLIEQLAIFKAASELGHSSIATTKTFYDHSKFSDAEYLQSAGK